MEQVKKSNKQTRKKASKKITTMLATREQSLKNEAIENAREGEQIAKIIKLKEQESKRFARMHSTKNAREK